MGFEFDPGSLEVQLPKEDVQKAVREALSNIKYLIEQREPEIFSNGESFFLDLTGYYCLHTFLRECFKRMLPSYQRNRIFMCFVSVFTSDHQRFSRLLRKKYNEEKTSLKN